MAIYTSLALEFFRKKLEQFWKKQVSFVWKWIVKLEKRSV